MPCSLTFLHTLVHCKMGLSCCTLSAVVRNSDLRLFDPTHITGERFAIPALFSLPFPTSDDHERNVCTYRSVLVVLITYSLFVSSLPLKELHKCFPSHLNTFKTVLVIWSTPLKDNSETTSPHHQATLPSVYPSVDKHCPVRSTTWIPSGFTASWGKFLVCVKMSNDISCFSCSTHQWIYTYCVCTLRTEHFLSAHPLL